MKTLLTLLLVLSFSVVHAQKHDHENDLKKSKSLLSKVQRSKLDSLLAIDWLDHSYTFLDADYDIKISHRDFQKSLKKGKFIPERITDHSDSLSVVLFAELKDNDATRIAAMRINYSWERLGWNLLMTQDEARNLAKELNFNKPYRVKEYVEDESITVNKRLEILNKLRKDVAQLEQVTENVDELNLKELFNRAFRYSPERLEKVKKIHAARKKS